jgi:hypothetical protein
MHPLHCYRVHVHCDPCRLYACLLLLGLVEGQRKIIGDIREQKISQVAGIDEREERVYRRPPTYLIIASKIVRPSTTYQVCPVPPTGYPAPPTR